MENKSVSVLIDTWLVQIIPAYQDIIWKSAIKQAIWTILKVASTHIAQMATSTQWQ